MGSKDKNKYPEGSMASALKRYIGYEVTLKTWTGDVLSGELINVSRYGLITLREPETLSPFLAERFTYIMYNDIEYFSVVVPTNP
ncbi:hypothetical protein [Bacillus sp. JJ1764]|uniref:hypothetical protein n=1 Tax=Bacillus sp. JJ1764 TaxID=3122964 RepID=UPI003000B5C6